MATKFRQDNVTVELTGDLERLALEAVDRILPGVRAEMEANVKDIWNSARGEWPEKTGRSRAGLETETVITDDALTIKIVNTVPYAIWVRPKAWFGTTTAWQRLVRTPMRAAAKDLAKTIGPLIVAQLSQGKSSG